MNLILAVTADPTAALKMLKSLGFTQCRLLFNRDNRATFRYTFLDKKTLALALGEPVSTTSELVTYKYNDSGYIVIEPSVNRVHLVNKDVKAPPQPKVEPQPQPQPKVDPSDKMADDAHVPVTHIPSNLQTTYKSCAANPNATTFRKTFMHNLWTYLNEAKFQNKLRAPNFVLTKNTSAQRTRTLAYWMDGRRILAVHPRLFNKSQDSFTETFLHEMCHQAVSELEPPGTARNEGLQGHGPSWQRWMTRVGLNPKRYNTDSRDDLLDKDEHAVIDAKKAAFEKLKPAEFPYRGLGVYHMNKGDLLLGMVIAKRFKDGILRYVVVDEKTDKAYSVVKDNLREAPVQSIFSSPKWESKYNLWKYTIKAQYILLADKEGNYDD